MFRKNDNLEDSKRELILKEEGQDYAQVLRMLGGGHVEVYCFSDDLKADVILKYQLDEARELQKLHEIPLNINFSETTVEQQDTGTDNIFFNEEKEEEEEEEDKRKQQQQQLSTEEGEEEISEFEDNEIIEAI